MHANDNCKRQSCAAFLCAVMQVLTAALRGVCSVHIVLNSNGKPTGNGYVQFASPEESKAAMAKDRKTLGSRYIELFACSQEELAEAA